MVGVKVGYGDFVQTYETEGHDGREIDTDDDDSVNMTRKQYMDNQGKKRKTVKSHLQAFWKCMKSDPLYKRQMAKRAHFKGINSVSQCDKISRIFFPASFFLLNLLYWFSYYYQYM